MRRGNCLHVTRALVAILAALVVAPPAFAATPLAIRPAVPLDDRQMGGATEWWHVLAFDPGSRTHVRAVLTARPQADFRIEVIRRGAATVDLAGGAMALVAQSSPGVAMVGTSPPAGTPPPTASLAYVAGRYVVDARSGAGAAHLEVAPGRAGPTVGPWQLGPLQTAWNPPVFRPGTRLWSVPVATGTARGWVEVDGRRVSVVGWRAYHDHTWGQFSLAAPSWYHSDFAVVSPRPGEAWIVNGLQPGDGKYRPAPDDRRWRGVLVHATRGRVVTCAAHVARSGWLRQIDHGDGWTYLTPDRVKASCPRAGSFVFRPEGGFRGLDGFGIGQEVGGSKPTTDGTGWIAHAMPPVPNT
jgi:hypothetical protein